MSTDDAYGSSHLTQWLLDTDSLEDFLQTLADAALELSRAQGAGLTLQRDGRPLTVVSAGTVAPKLHEKQYGQDDDPCLQALHAGEELRIDDMAEETRWDDDPAYAAACGIRSSLSLPIAAHTHTAAALNLYAGPPSAFGQADLTALRTLAAQATGAIALAQRITDTQEFAQQLQDAMRYRSIIDQALGSSRASADAPPRKPSAPCAPPPSTATSNSATCAPSSSPPSPPPTAPELRPHP